MRGRTLARSFSLSDQVLGEFAPQYKERKPAAVHVNPNFPDGFMIFTPFSPATVYNSTGLSFLSPGGGEHPLGEAAKGPLRVGFDRARAG